MISLTSVTPIILIKKKEQKKKKRKLSMPMPSPGLSAFLRDSRFVDNPVSFLLTAPL